MTRLLVSAGSLSLFAVSAFAIEELPASWPQASRPHEVVAMVIQPSDLSGLVPVANYATSENAGMCVGIDALNNAMLTNLRFAQSESKKDSAEVISAKLVAACAFKSPQTIHGFSDREEFMKAMEQNWEQGANPVKAAVESVQSAQRDKISLSARAHRALSNNPGLETEEQAKRLMTAIMNSRLTQISMADEGGGHAVTVVGYRKYQRRELPHEFFVIDPNHPREIKTLVLRNERRTPNGEMVQTESHWYYESWKGDSAPPKKEEPQEVPKDKVLPNYGYRWQAYHLQGGFYYDPYLDMVVYGNKYAYDKYPSELGARIRLAKPVTNGEVILNIPREDESAGLSRTPFKTTYESLDTGLDGQEESIQK